MNARLPIALLTASALACASKGPPPPLETVPIRDPDASTTSSFAPLPSRPFASSTSPFGSSTSRFSKEQLSAAECDQLADRQWQHYLKQYGQAPPHRPAPGGPRSEVALHEREACMRETSRGQFDCAMAAKDFVDFRGCLRTIR